MISRIFGALPNSLTQKLTATYFTGKISNSKTRKASCVKIKSSCSLCNNKNIERILEISKSNCATNDI